LALTGDDVEFPNDDEEEVVDHLVSKHQRRIQCQEDDDFMAAFDKMVSENIQDRMKEAVKPPRCDITVPMNLKSSSSKKGYGMFFLDLVFFKY
jgi:regulator of nonsense transcripts 2